jgi:hypothetical protein
MFDADKTLNPGVAKGSQNLAATAARMKCCYYNIFWDRDGAVEKLRELYQIAHQRHLEIPSDLRAAIKRKSPPRNPWATVKQLADQLWVYREEVDARSFQWRKEGKGIDDFLLNCDGEDIFAAP